MATDREADRLHKTIAARADPVHLRVVISKTTARETMASAAVATREATNKVTMAAHQAAMAAVADKVATATETVMVLWAMVLQEA